MMNRCLCWPTVASCVATLVFGVTGCGKPQAVKGTGSTIKPLSILFFRYTAQHRGQTPLNREELEKFINAQGPTELEVLGAKDMNDLFTSARDQQPYIVRYGVTVPPPGPGGPTVVAYETKGVSGRWLVAFSTAGVDEVDASKLKELVPDAKP